MKKILLLLVVVLMISAACPALAAVDMLAANVGKGDALLLRAGDYVCLIDTGKKDAQEDIEAALDYWDISALDALFITHTDKDHTGGLKWLRKSDLEIRAIYASKYHPDTTRKKHQAVKTAEKLDLEVQWLGAGDSVPMGDSGAVLRVLAPAQEVPGNEDDNSLVMMLESPDGRMLLAGDMERVEESLLLQSGADLKCDVLKVPNHADSDACSKALIQACGAKVAVISTSTKEKSDTPDATVLKNLKKAGYETYITQECKLGVYVCMNGGEITAQYLN